MKNKVILILIILAVLAIIGINLTGFTTEGGEEIVIGVTRLITEDIEGGITNVQLKVVSSENVLAVQEVFIGDSCALIDYYSVPDIDIFEANEQEVVWILANRSDTLVLDLYYTIPVDCKVDEDAGKVYTLNDTKGLEGFGITGEEELPFDDHGGNGGGGGSSGGIPPSFQIAVLQSTPIQQAEDKKDFNEKVQQAIEKISEIETPKRTGWFIIIALILVILFWVVILKNLFLKKRKIKGK